MNKLSQALCQVTIVRLAKREKERRSGKVRLFIAPVLYLRQILGVQFCGDLRSGHPGPRAAHRDVLDLWTV